MRAVAAFLVLSCVVFAANTADLRLIEAVKSRDPQTAKVLVGQHVDVNAAQPDGATALAWAAFVGDRATAALLISSGAKVNTADEYGESPLTLAAANGDAEIVGRLLKAGAEAKSAQWNHETALMKAANSGSLECVNLLLAAGADVNATESSKGQTALMWAASESHSDIVKTLLDHGADVNVTSKSGFTALVFSTLKNDAESIRYELAAHADPNYALRDGARVLSLAATLKNTAAAKILMEGGADYGTMDRNGATAFHIAAQSGDKELIDLLLAKGVAADLGTGAAPKERATGPAIIGARLGIPHDTTALMLATRNAHVEIMKALLAAGADPKHKAQDGTTLLMMASYSGKLPVVEFAYKLDPSTAKEFNAQAMNAVHFSVSAFGPSTHEAHHEVAEIVKFLWDKGTEIDIKSGQGRTAIEMSDRLPNDQAVDMITELLAKAGRQPIVPTMR